MSSLDILALSLSNKPMPYSKFTLSRAVEDFDLTVREESNLFADIEPISPTSLLREILVENVPWAIAVGSEKARSEGIINPVLLEVKRQLGVWLRIRLGGKIAIIARSISKGLTSYMSNYI
jgi:hypothetical protein